MGNTIAHLAHDQQWDEVRSRIEAHAIEDVNVTTGGLNWTTLCFASWHGQLDIVQLLLKYKGIQVNKANSDGMTPLHEAAKHGHFEVAKALVDAGADPHALNNDGAKPLDLSKSTTISQFLTMCMMPVEVCAERQEWHEVVRRVTRQLLPDVNTRFGEKTWTLLSYAAIHDQIKIVDLLVRYKNINLNASNADGMTALHEAAQHNHLQVLSILLRAGADPNLRNLEGKTPIDLATSDGCTIFELEKSSAAHSTGPLKPCPHCTFENTGDSLHCKVCEMDLANSENAVAVLMQRIQLLEEAQLCSICEEHPKDTVFTCGHETCMNCAERLTNCPNCREPITARIRRFCQAALSLFY